MPVVGSTVLVDFPGSTMHGKRCRVVAVEPEFNLAPEGEPAWPAMTIFVQGAGMPEPVGIGLERIAGTVEATRRRAADAGDGGSSQGELLL